MGSTSGGNTGGDGMMGIMCLILSPLVLFDFLNDRHILYVSVCVYLCLFNSLEKNT